MKKLTLIVTTLIFVFIGSGCNSFQSMEHSKAEYSNSEDDFSLSAGGCLVLNYHRIRSPDWFTKTLEKLTHNTELTTYSVYTNEFKKQILYLKEKGIPFITPADLETYVSGEKPMPKKCALITFDDIDVSVYEHAYPFLKEENIPFTVFIITGQVGNPDFDGLKMVTWKQLEEMNRSGLATIGTHTHKLHYIEPNEKAPFLKEKNLNLFKQDSLEAIKVYKQHFGTEPIYFAYPYGYGIPKTDEILLNQGYHLIFSLNPGTVKVNDPRFFINRVLVDRGDWKVIERWANS